jgi:predicted AlkP superfamily pyrophosphatase or phosphodiesterase
MRLRPLALFFFGLAAVSIALAQPGPRQNFKKPKLVLGIAIDQFRFDYLNRWHKEYTGAFARFDKQAAIFTNAHHEHFPTVTAIGHSTFMSGATPSISGIVNNSWFDRTTGKTVTSVSDDSTELLGAPGKGSSPHRLLASTIGDELKMAGKSCKVIGISIKDRSAILPAGHAADGAYWFDGGTGNFVSSTWYFPELPAWVKDYNASRTGDKFLNAEWKELGSDKVLKKMAAVADAKFYNGLEATPYGNELIESFAERALEAEQLGRHPDTDVLTVSFSANDYVGHAVGPDDPMVKDISLRTDQLLEKFLSYVDSKVGLENVIVVLTADHGVAPMPEVNRRRHMPGGRFSQGELFGAIETALTAKYGEGKWIVGSAGPIPYFNRDLIRQKKLAEGEVEKTAAEAVRQMPNIFRVFTREQIITGEMIDDRFSQRVRNGFYPPRSGDLIVIPDAYWIFEAHGASHGTAFNYDTHVPVIFMGANIVPGRYDGQVAVNDIAPTLAAMLEIEIPSGAVGRVLSEMLTR